MPRTKPINHGVIDDLSAPKNPVTGMPFTFFDPFRMYAMQWARADFANSITQRPDKFSDVLARADAYYDYLTGKEKLADKSAKILAVVRPGKKKKKK